MGCVPFWSRMSREPRPLWLRGSLFFSTESLNHSALKVRDCLLARRRVAVVTDNTRSGPYENRPEPGFTLRGFLRAHDVPNAVL
jgi:hypothetical protein